MSIIRITVEIDTDKTGDPTDVGQLALTDYLVDQVTPKVKRQLRRAPGCICTHPEVDDLLINVNGNRAGTVKVEVDPKPATMWVLRRAEYGDPTPFAAYDNEDLAQAAYERYDETWGNYDLDEVPLNPETPPPGSVYAVRLDAKGSLLSNPSAHAYTPDHRDLSNSMTRTVTTLTERKRVYDRCFVVWAEDSGCAVTSAREEKERLDKLGLWETDGQIVFGEDGPE